MTLLEAYKRLNQKDSPPGMRVPRGGSNCAKCMYAKDEKCINRKFIDASFGKKKAGDSRFIDPGTGKEVPGDEYCCNYFDYTKS